MGITDLDTVFFVIDAIPVLVDPDHVTGLGVVIAVHESIALGVVVVDLLLALEDTFAGDTQEVTDRLAGLGAETVLLGNVLGDDLLFSVDDTVGIVDVEDVVLVVRAIESDAVAEITDTNVCLGTLEWSFKSAIFLSVIGISLLFFSFLFPLCISLLDNFLHFLQKFTWNFDTVSLSGSNLFTNASNSKILFDFISSLKLLSIFSSLMKLFFSL